MSQRKGGRALKKKDCLIKRIWKAKFLYLALLPSIGLLCVFSLYPALSGVFRSLFNWKTKNYFSPEFCGLEQYTRLFQDAEFWKSFGVLLIFIVAGFITTFGICMPVTYLIFRLGSTRAGKIFQRAFVIPMMIPGMVGTMFWRFFYLHRTGILDTILRFVGKDEWIRIWLADNDITLWALLFIGFPFVGGFSMLIFLSGFLNIDSSLEESAEMDGASGWKKFMKIYLPLVVPQIKVLSILGMIGAIQGFGTQLIMTDGKYGTNVPAYYMYTSAFKNGNYGYASAQGVILFLIILVITILQQKYIQETTS